MANKLITRNEIIAVNPLEQEIYIFSYFRLSFACLLPSLNIIFWRKKNDH